MQILKSIYPISLILCVYIVKEFCSLILITSYSKTNPIIGIIRVSSTTPITVESSRTKITTTIIRVTKPSIGITLSLSEILCAPFPFGTLLPLGVLLCASPLGCPIFRSRCPVFCVHQPFFILHYLTILFYSIMPIYDTVNYPLTKLKSPICSTYHRHLRAISTLFPILSI